MPAIHWVDDDEGYERWLSEHGDGFMANMNKQPSPRYFRVHRASHNLPDRSNPDTVNPRTGNDYSKVTADLLPELIAWAKKNLPTLDIGTSNYCKTCAPTDDSPVESSPTTDLAEYHRRADQILSRGCVERPVGIFKPKVAQANTVLFYRDPKVRAWVLKRADGRCELCEMLAPFLTDREEPYLESHHLVMLSDGGPDIPDNTAALCPNCHRMLHHGKGRGELRERLTRMVLGKEAALAEACRR